MSESCSGRTEDRFQEPQVVRVGGEDERVLRRPGRPGMVVSGDRKEGRCGTRPPGSGDGPSCSVTRSTCVRFTVFWEATRRSSSTMPTAPGTAEKEHLKIGSAATCRTSGSTALGSGSTGGSSAHPVSVSLQLLEAWQLAACHSSARRTVSAGRAGRACPRPYMPGSREAECGRRGRRARRPRVEPWH